MLLCIPPKLSHAAVPRWPVTPPLAKFALSSQPDAQLDSRSTPPAVVPWDWGGPDMSTGPILNSTQQAAASTGIHSKHRSHHGNAIRRPHRGARTHGSHLERWHGVRECPPGGSPSQPGTTMPRTPKTCDDCETRPISGAPRARVRPIPRCALPAMPRSPGDPMRQNATQCDTISRISRPQRPTAPAPGLEPFEFRM